MKFGSAVALMPMHADLSAQLLHNLRAGPSKARRWPWLPALFCISRVDGRADDGRMRTIRLSDPFPRGKPANKLEWGTSAWAADSCLVEWSRLEREWLDVPAARSAPAPVWRWSASDLPRHLWLGIALLGCALVWVTFS